MAAFRLFSRLNTFYGLTGQLLASGSLKFYDAGTTTPRPVYGDSGLTVNNGVTIPLDSSGRPNVDVWGDGSYFVEVFDSLGVKQGDADNVEIPGGGQQAIPPLANGQFLTNNGSLLLWAGIQQVPDMTDQAGKLLGTDGTLPLWQDPPAPPADPDIAVTANSFRAGVSDQPLKWFEQTGSGSAAATGTKTATATIPFPVPFTDTPAFVDIVPMTASACATPNIIPSWAVTNKSATEFTVTFSTLTGGSSSDNYGGSSIVSAILFMWKATGTKTG